MSPYSTSYTVWREGRDDAARSYVAENAGGAAVQAANNDHRHAHGYEWDWPVTYIVKNTANGRSYKVVVEREAVPEFTAGKPREIK